MSFFRTTGPASMEVWISSPVRSRKPVLMKATRSRAAPMQALRFSVVRRSSSMIPTLMVSGGIPSTCSTRENSSTVNATSSGPCIFGFTTYIEPVSEFASLEPPRRSRQAAEAGDQRVEDPLGHLVAVGVEHGVGGHHMADLADEQQRAAPQRDLLAGGAVQVRSGFIGRGEGLPVLGHLGGEGALHQLQPVAVADDLVVRGRRRRRSPRGP